MSTSVGAMARTTTHPTSAHAARVPSFEAVVRDCYDDVLRLAWLITGDQHQAEDAVAEALAKMLRRWRKSTIDNPPAYLRRAVVNEVNSAFRRLRTERRHRERRHAEHRGHRSADEQIVDADAVGRALTQLPPKQRTAVALLYYEGLSQAEAAEAMGCSVGTVKSNCSRGLDRLRALLEGQVS